jgi:probable phosphoglycerate mutase
MDDVLNSYGGCADFELTEKGLNTAKEHSNNLIGLGIERIFTSPYKRAKNVAKIFSDKINIEMEIVNNLREINTYGVMSGVNKDEAKKLFEFYLNSDEYKEFGYYKGESFYGGEIISEFDNRVLESFKYIVNSNYKTVAIVTHGGVFRSIYKNILKKEEKILDIEDVGTIEIEYDGNNFNFISMKGIKI